MKRIELADITAASLEPLIQPGSKEPVLVTTHGQTIAAVVPLASEQDIEELALAHSPQFEAILARSQKRLETEGGFRSDEMRRSLGL